MTSRHPPHNPHRRALLRRAALLGAAFGAASPLAWAPLPSAAAADDYRALVCVFLYGGNDGANTVVPFDAARHAQYAATRGPLALPRARLLPLEGSALALHPALAALLPAWQRGQLAPVLNVGPLQRPLTKADYLAAAGVPESLFSHPDQRALWETAGVDPRERAGWGGRAASALATTNPVFAFGDNSHFGAAADQPALRLPGPGGVLGGWGLQAQDRQWPAIAARQDALLAMYTAPQDSDLAQHFAGRQLHAFSTATKLAELVAAQPGQHAPLAAVDAAFAPLWVNGQSALPLAGQLYQVAKLVAARSAVGGTRQVFLTQLDGFDTHGDQVARDDVCAGTHAALLAQLGAALAAFQQAMVAIGMDRAVTCFTQSDFGRTLAPNASLGSDHGWGNHHLVLGGAVHGGRSWGVLPNYGLGGADDAERGAWERQGRWIPTTAVAQYAAPLLRWLGADDAQTQQVLPALQAFAPADLAFV